MDSANNNVFGNFGNDDFANKRYFGNNSFGLVYTPLADSINISAPEPSKWVSEYSPEDGEDVIYKYRNVYTTVIPKYDLEGLRKQMISLSNQFGSLCQATNPPIDLLSLPGDSPLNFDASDFPKHLRDTDVDSEAPEYSTTTHAQVNPKITWSDRRQGNRYGNVLPLNGTIFAPTDCFNKQLLSDTLCSYYLNASKISYAIGTQNRTFVAGQAPAADNMNQFFKAVIAGNCNIACLVSDNGDYRAQGVPTKKI